MPAGSYLGGYFHSGSFHAGKGPLVAGGARVTETTFCPFFDNQFFGVFFC